MELNIQELKIPKLVIFDWDNTLVSTWNKLLNALNTAFTETSLPLWDIETIQREMHHSSRDFFPKHFGDKWQRAREVFYQEYASCTQEVEPLLGALETLEKLVSHNIYCAIISNKTGHILRDEVEKLGWNKYFKSILGAYDCDEDKPSPKPVLKTLENIGFNSGIEPKWFIGDTIVDMECAHTTDCSPLLFGPQSPTAKHPKDHGIKHLHITDHLHFQKVIAYVIG